MQTANAKRKKTFFERLGELIAFFGVSWVFYMIISPERSEKVDEKAFKACEAQMKIIAHPNYALVPRTNGLQSGAEYYFAWPKGSGLVVAGADSAACFVNFTTLEISSLTLNGKERIWRQPDR